jgi:hypothetical protein
MRKALIPAFLLVLGAVVLGSTAFREQLVNAATTPFQNVVVTNTPTNPVPVQQVGASTTSVSGTVGIDPAKNTVNLGSTDGGRLASIANAVGKLKFDSGGNLETTAQAAAPGAITQHCLMIAVPSNWDVDNDGQSHTLCTDDFYVTDITAAGMDDNLELDFYYQGDLVLDLNGSSHGGADSYQLDLTHPLHVDKVVGGCGNTSTDCDFNLALLGNSTGN